MSFFPDTPPPRVVLVDDRHVNYHNYLPLKRIGINEIYVGTGESSHLFCSPISNEDSEWSFRLAIKCCRGRQRVIHYRNGSLINRYDPPNPNNVTVR